MSGGTSTAANILQQFHWDPQPEAERLIGRLLSAFLTQCPAASKLADRLHSEAGVRFADCIDHIHPARSSVTEAEILAAGFEASPSEKGVYRHPGGIFPPLALYERDAHTVALKVDSVSDFLATQGIATNITGRPGDSVRLAFIERDLAAVERHGTRAIYASRPKLDDATFRTAAMRFESLRLRPRHFDDAVEGFRRAEEMLDAAIGDLGVDYACDLFFAAEREYWQRRNRAAQVQKARQDRLGIGWANHDHHTYRCSRKHFSRLVALWEKLGFHCRERFYAGKEAGWGAQVMEQSNAGIVTFNDVDLSPDELLVDFAHEPLPERRQLGTVGLWCGLHGESFLEAGMHHLECTFDFAALKEQLERDHGVNVMKPFTDFPYLRQAFTQGERWPVGRERIATLLSLGQITQEQADKFRTEGAIGSHLENLERNQGFKGFNQTGVSEIIAATDPRKH